MIGIINERIEKLRLFMRDNGIQAYIVQSTDPHSGEYIAMHWESRKWISGFTGSAGTVVVTLKKAGLWTDSRYFIQAEEQLKGSDISLFKEKLPGTPTICEWLLSELSSNDNVGIDPWTNGISNIENLESRLKEKGIHIKYTIDPFDSIWADRPSIPDNKIFVHNIAYAGATANEKIAQIRKHLNDNNADAIVISALDEISWTLNLRGNDIHCNPVFISYLTITKDNATLYIDEKKMTDEVRRHLANSNVTTKPYKSIKDDLICLSSSAQRILISPLINGGIFDIVKNVSFISPSPVLYLKAVKNSVEIKGFHKSMIRDGVAMVKFLIWIKDAVKKGNQSELSISQKLYILRKEQALFVGESFDTIAGYKENAAIVHYEADENSDKKLEAEGMLLLDSGGQYLDGTTDITRTIILGKISEEEKKDYTLVLKGMIDLSMAEFPQGTCGTQLDVLARAEMWKNGINYLHGTGHGVGHFLNVHEGPHQFRMNYMPALLVPGMTITNEPGIYKTGRHGVRIENTMLIIKSRTTEFGEFYKFEPLTLCPIDKEGIDINILENKEVEWLNNYHYYIYQKLSPYLSEQEKIWLKEMTSPINK